MFTKEVWMKRGCVIVPKDEKDRFILLWKRICYLKKIEKCVSSRRIIPCSFYQSAAFILKIEHTHTYSTHTQTYSHILNICPPTNLGNIRMDVWKSHAGQQMPIKIFSRYFSAVFSCVYVLSAPRQTALWRSAVLSWHDFTATMHC